MSSVPIVSTEELDAYLGSYVGMLGNRAAPVWLCDVSPHTVSTPLATPLIPWREPAVWDAEFRKRNKNEMLRWGGHQKAARIMASSRNADSDVSVDWESYYWSQLYARSGNEFRLSLFPLPTGTGASRCWRTSHLDQPALNPQNRYLDLCRHGDRFSFIAALRKRMAPKVIVCFGPRYADDFQTAFGFVGTPASEMVLQPADLPKRLQVFTKADSTLVIAPLLGGTGGLNSGILQEALGRYIGKILNA